MLITQKKDLEKYETGHRIWQGIPSIERTQRGRLFAAFYSGGIKEQAGNYCMLVKSDDDGVTWTEPIAVAYKNEQYRCYDQCLWIDPLGRLWFIWSLAPEHAVYAAICENPDADELVWGKEFAIGNDLMLNKPTVLSDGSWIFPITVWDKDVFVVFKTKTEHSGPFVYKTVDGGKSFERLGCPNVENRSFDEHMIVEMKDKSLMMLIRTSYGIGKSYSYDGGKTWTDACDSKIPGPNARFHIKRLRSGRILLINHYNFTDRNNLTALLSEDDGKTWAYSLLIDERESVAYPDAVETDDGKIYIIYYRERGSFKNSYEEAHACAREILMAKITEDDIIHGKIVSEGSRLKCIVSELGDFDGNADALYEKKENKNE